MAKLRESRERALAVGRPDENALKACRLLGRRLVEHVKVVKAGLRALGSA